MLLCGSVYVRIGVENVNMNFIYRCADTSTCVLKYLERTQLSYSLEIKITVK